jgi:tRNA-specific 2-thiouridylase
MSGGVDSSLAAALLREQGHEVIGVSMRLWEDEEGDPLSRTCCSLESVEDARRVCQFLDIPFYPLNLTREFQKYVIDYFCREYSLGRTPNPCLACNHFVKFHFLLGKAKALGANYLATGHYARIVRSNGDYRLLRSTDAQKDQSYVLYTLGQEELAHLLFPVGGYSKEEVRRMAAARGLPVAAKPDSQEICFISNGDYRSFLAGRVPLRQGPLVDQQGKVVGHHRGIAFYTIGQRRGLGLALGTPRYVVEIDASQDTVMIGPREELETHTLLAKEVSFVSGQEPEMPTPVQAKIRYRSPLVEATLSRQGTGVRVDFAQPQQAVTPGQAVVFYRGEEVLGGGTIEKVLRG